VFLAIAELRDALLNSGEAFSDRSSRVLAAAETAHG
jgi:hypothetical protein